MNIFSAHQSVVDDYRHYIGSFVNIADAVIGGVVERELSSGKLWPEPLLHFNPSFREAGPVRTLVAENQLHPDFAHIFHGYTLFQHQTDAIRLGLDGRDFVVTSGTGSGKSLTYIATIFQQLLSRPKATGVQAIIVYPMNALINSQTDELNRHKASFEAHSGGRDFPIRFQQYTGQENEEARQQMRDDPPHILLTNYMMLELILTRAKQGERALRQSIFENLRFLVFDELHTYRGRQGADVALLIRRLRSQCAHDPLCVGTSATMVSGGTLAAQAQAVATVASTIFGKPFQPDQVVRESLDRSFATPDSSHRAALTEAVQQPVNPRGEESALRTHATAVWLENAIALSTQEETLVRGRPRTLSEIVAALAEASGVEVGTCQTHLRELLDWINSINLRLREGGRRYTYLPFKLHQFFAQSGSVFCTLDEGEARHVTLDPAPYILDGDEKKPLYPTVFSRASGETFHCVTLDPASGQLLTREFKDSTEENDEEIEDGYLLPNEAVWNPEEDLECLPPAWLRERKNGELVPIKAYARRLPRPVTFSPDGRYSEGDDLPLRGWFMPTPLLFDPSSGLVFGGNTKENTKLASLGTEGRSTSTTVTAFSALAHLAAAGLATKDQKLLSFTDNRQDAALQAGHFNDFVNVIRLRSAIHKALRLAPDKQLTFANLGERVSAALALATRDYAGKDLSEAFPHVRRSYEEALQLYLVYRALHDLRRGWRVILPNLEQCALLRIEYLDFDEVVQSDAAWSSLAPVGALAHAERSEFLRAVLEFFRLEFALSSEIYLSEKRRAEHAKEIREKLKQPWTFDSDDDVPVPRFVRFEKLARFNRMDTASAGPNSGLEKFVRQFFRKHLALDMNRADYLAFIPALFRMLDEAGYLDAIEAKNHENQTTLLYQLRLDRVVWCLGDEQTLRPDAIKQRSYRDLENKPNPFFQRVYKRDYASEKSLRGEDHTGQLKADDRIEREARFKAGETSVLFCSPTMELGVDISELNLVHMRNAPPSPANYAQRSGRAGRSGQAALVFTFCSSYSSHDRHYFNNQSALVAGTVPPPRLDLLNEELIRSHLHAFVLGHKGLAELDSSMENLLELADPALPLMKAARSALVLNDREFRQIRTGFQRVLADILPALASHTHWFSAEWIEARLQAVTASLDGAAERWRILFRDARRLLSEASRVIESGLHTSDSKELRRAKSDAFQAQRQIDLLRNNPGKGQHRELTEFYPYRYFAAEGFLPGYNFYRLPVRNFVQTDNDSGEFISRPRPIALREFGPGNLIYHKGRKYLIAQMVVTDAEHALRSAQISKGSGYFMSGDEATLDVCPFSGADLSDNANKQILHDLLELGETRAVQRDRITCEEEERTSRGYSIETYFSLPGDGRDRCRKAVLKLDGEPLLKLHHLPAATIVHINHKWRVRRNTGYPFGLVSGRWLRESELEDRPDDAEPYRIVRLFTTETADALYIEPLKSLGLEAPGVITLQYALKRAIEDVFQMEPRELSADTMGRVEAPNIFLYESAEGSLGILSQLVRDPTRFAAVAARAYELCRFDDPDYPEGVGATYNDLLDYYNQRHHGDIDRALIRGALEALRACQVEALGGSRHENYDAHYADLLRQIDPNSSTEHAFLKHLYENNLRLPDAAQKTVPGIYVQPDFHYAPDVWIFCDGTPHDQPAVQEDDAAKREALRNQGHQVFVWHYRENLAAKLATRPDIFYKIKN
jgi:superfamily II DNA/RNA helicase